MFPFFLRQVTAFATSPRGTEKRAGDLLIDEHLVLCYY
jgi:hypothetical protein